MNFFSKIPIAPPDSVFVVKRNFIADTDPNKQDLGIGMYFDETGHIPNLDCCKKAMEILVSDPKYNHPYLPIAGYAPFYNEARNLLLGKNNPATERVSSVQALSGTGALRLVGEFLHLFFPETTVYIPIPSWPNHARIFQHSHLQVKTYRYLFPDHIGLDFDSLILDIKNAPDNSVFLFHACAHNPTGVDLNHEQWRIVMDVIEKRQSPIVIDIAYQGFASGNLEEDSYMVRNFVKFCHVPIFICQSFSKSLSLYGERVGALHVVCPNPDEVIAIKSQLEVIIRGLYSNPPAFGARLAHLVMSNADINSIWVNEMKTMSNRITKMRSLLRKNLEELKVPGDWSHITSQIGMFSYCGLKQEQCQYLTDKYHIHLIPTGRICIAALTEEKIGYLANSIKETFINFQKS